MEQIVENFRPGVMEDMGLGWATLHARHPTLISAHISGFGQTGGPQEKKPVLGAARATCTAVHTSRRAVCGVCPVEAGGLGPSCSSSSAPLAALCHGVHLLENLAGQRAPGPRWTW